jgi:hypothetical protein
MKFPNKMPVFSKKRLNHRSPADGLRQEGIPAERPDFSDHCPPNSDIAKPAGVAITNGKRLLYINTM